MEKGGHPLGGIPGFSIVHTRKLAELNITTAEEFVSLTGVGEQANRVADFLGVGADQVRELIALAGNSLPDAVRKQMAEPVDTHLLGFGALPPKAREKTTDEQKQ